MNWYTIPMAFLVEWIGDDALTELIILDVGCATVAVIMVVAMLFDCSNWLTLVDVGGVIVFRSATPANERKK